MSDIIIHPKTQQQLDLFFKKPAQAIVLSGPAGSGKLMLAQQLTAGILGLEQNQVENHAYIRIISPVEGKSIGIESIRELEHFLSLKVPSKAAHNRAVIIEDSHLLTVEAQNALLKTLEEPPAGTIIIMTVSHDRALLPTIRSRSQLMVVHKPARDKTERYFSKQGLGVDAVSQAYAISGGLPGLMSAILSDEEHPLLTATEQARQLLSQPQYERLLTVESLAKQRQLALSTVDILQQMAHVSLQTAKGDAAKRWQAVQRASYATAAALRQNAQPKLVLTNLVLQF